MGDFKGSRSAPGNGKHNAQDYRVRDIDGFRTRPISHFALAPVVGASILSCGDSNISTARPIHSRHVDFFGAFVNQMDVTQINKGVQGEPGHKNNKGGYSLESGTCDM